MTTDSKRSTDETMATGAHSLEVESKDMNIPLVHVSSGSPSSSPPPPIITESRNNKATAHTLVMPSGETTSLCRRLSRTALLQRHCLPDPPDGVQWVWDETSNRRWTIQALVEADAEIVACSSNSNHGGDDDDDERKSWRMSTNDNNTILIGNDDDDDDDVVGAETDDFIRHYIKDSDTLQGICLQYGITPTQLRRANFGFSGENLSLAPNPLQIPNIRKATPMGVLHSSSSEQPIPESDRVKQVAAMSHLFQGILAETEVKSYLALNDWKILDAIRNAKADLGEKEIGIDPYGERARFDTPIQQVMIDEDL